MSVRSELDLAWAEWQNADLYKKWRRSNPGEASKLDAYRAGGPRPTLATATGRALVAETAAWLEAGTVVEPPPPPPSSFTNTGIATFAFRDGQTLTDTRNYTGTSILGLDARRGGTDSNQLATAKAANPNNRVLMYKIFAEGWDLGIGAAVPSEYSQFSVNSAVTYNEALLHDQQYPNDRWLLRNSDGSLMTVAGGWPQWMLDPGAATFSQQWIANSLKQLQAEGWDGIWMDNVFDYLPRPWSDSSATPAYRAYKYVGGATGSATSGTLTLVYGTHDAYRNAMLAHLQRISAALRPTYYLTSNIIAWPRYGTGESQPLRTASWIQTAAPYMDCAFTEYWCGNGGNTDRRLIDAEWANQMTMMTTALNSGIDFWANTYSYYPGTFTLTNGQQNGRYGRGSFLLYWDGQSSSVFSCNQNDGYEQYQTWYAEPTMTTPQGSVTVTNGVYMRQYEDGKWVAVNPQTTSRTVTVGSTSRTIASGDAFIGVS